MPSRARTLAILSELTAYGAMLGYLLANVGVPGWGVALILVAYSAGLVWARLWSPWRRASEGVGAQLLGILVGAGIGTFFFMAAGLWIGALAQLIICLTAARLIREDHEGRRALA